jgi:hypothetical protein
MHPSNVIHRRRVARNKVKESRLKAVEAQQEVIEEATPEPVPVQKQESVKIKRKRKTAD